MRFRWPWNRSDTLQLARLLVAALLLLVAVLALIPNWVPLLEDRGYQAPWLMPALRSLHRVRWWIIAFVACAVGVLVVRRFSNQLLSLLEWLVWGGKRLYIWVVWDLLSSPVRDYVAMMAVHRAVGKGSAPATAYQSAQEVRWDISGLSNNALSVLQFALGHLDTGSAQPCWVDAWQAIQPPEGRGGFPNHELEEVCKELVRRSVVAQYDVDYSQEGVSLWLRSEIVEAERRGLVSRLVKRELAWHRE